MPTPTSFPWLAATLANELPSDWHLTPGSALRVRVEGRLRSVEDVRVTEEILAELEKQAPAADDELDIVVSGARRRFRLHRFTTRGRRAIVLRHIPVTPPTLESIHGLPPTFVSAMQKPQGLFLIGGATGSGKSTTLAATLDRINRNGSAVIVTAENPIEFVHTARESSVVYQLAYGHDFTSWTDALKDALRKDPDVIALGELRDPETIFTALIAANTGHQVFATVHGGDATTILDRMISIFPGSERQTVCAMIDGCLRAVLAQRLVNTVDGKRTAIFELLTATNGARVTIRENKLHQLAGVLAAGRMAGMQTFDEHIERLLGRRLITSEEARNHHSRPDEIKN